MQTKRTTFIATRNATFVHAFGEAHASAEQQSKAISHYATNYATIDATFMETQLQPLRSTKDKTIVTTFCISKRTVTTA